MQVRIDGVLAATCIHSLLSVGTKKWSATGARDTAGTTFTANQTIELYCDIVGTATLNGCIAIAEVQFDT